VELNDWKRQLLSLARRAACASAVLLIGAQPVLADNMQLYVYPAHGQSYEQQQQDQFQCYEFGKNATGFDPMAAAPPPPPAAPKKAGFFGGAFAGALIGVAVGAIAGNAGEGAAIGAASGGLFGGMRSQQQRNQQQQAQQQQAAQLADERSNYNRAYSACLEGRGYTVD
jgi:predicted lipid-binding transport protein (Tim44 family)